MRALRVWEAQVAEERAPVAVEEGAVLVPRPGLKSVQSEPLVPAWAPPWEPVAVPEGRCLACVQSRVLG